MAYETLKGTTHPDDWYVIGAHYDSTSENIKVAAPGTENNIAHFLTIT